MDTTEENAKPASITSPINMAQLEPKLDDLLSQYRNALMIIARQPRIGRWRTTTRASGLERGRDRRRWVIRPFARVFVESHIRSRINVIVRILKVELIRLTDNDDAKRLQTWTKRMSDVKRMLPGWTGFYGLLAKAPVIPILFPILGAAISRLLGVDFSGAGEFTTSTMKLAQSGNWQTIFRALLVLAMLLVYVYMLFSAIVVGIGFRFKRAIFAGGSTFPDVLDRLVFDRVWRVEKWKDLPETNIYHVENEVFDAFRVPKPREFPLDLVASTRPYLVFAITIFVTVGLKTAGSISWQQVVFMLALWFASFSYCYSGIVSYRERVKNGEL